MKYEVKYEIIKAHPGSLCALAQRKISVLPPLSFLSG
jgi:hypothetical protein